VSVDEPRKTFPISGTSIRENPMKNWKFICGPAKPYFARKVLVIGAESTGKTTLARDLAKHYDTVWCPEYAREYLDKKEGKLDVNDQIPIAFGHVSEENALLQKANKVMFTDTDAITTCIYFDHYFGFVEKKVYELSLNEKYDLVLLTHPDVPWVADPQRDLPHLRKEMHKKFEDALTERGMEWIDVKGTWDERWKRATRAVDALIGK
jgi:HTH-type transcriptional repressor of NAD biosynthesis genes